MAFINEYPYSDFNEYNMDWIIKTVKDLSVAWAETKTEWGDMQTEFEDLKRYIDSYFEDLDVQEEINKKLDEMAADGTLSLLIQPYIGDQITTWLEAHIDPDSGYVIDDSLSVEDAAADAKAAGDHIFSVENTVDALSSNEMVIFTRGYFYRTTAVGTTSPLTPEASSSFTCAKVPVTKGDFFYINGNGSTGQYRKYIVTDSAGVILELGSASSTGVLKLLIKQDDAAYLCINILQTSPDIYAYKKINLQDATVYAHQIDWIKTFGTELTPLGWQTGYYNTSGQTGASDSVIRTYRTKYYQATKDDIKITLEVPTGYYAAICEYDSDGSNGRRIGNYNSGYNIQHVDVTEGKLYRFCVGYWNDGDAADDITEAFLETVVATVYTRGVYALEDIYGRLDALETATPDADTIPAYYSSYLPDKISDIIKLQNTMSVNSDSFIFITDYHTRTNEGHSLSILSHIVQRTGINKLFFGGDSGGALGTSESARITALQVSLDAWARIQNSAPQFYGVLGNHEWIANYFTDAAIIGGYLNRFMTKSEPQAVTEYGCFYIDNPVNQVRYFFIQDTIGASIITGGQDWFGKQLELVPSGYSVVTIVHHGFIPNDASYAEYNNVTIDDTTPSMVVSHRISQLLDAFQSQTTITMSGETYDYTGTNGTVIGIFCGHIHHGILFTKTDAYNTDHVTVFQGSSDALQAGTVEINGHPWYWEDGIVGGTQIERIAETTNEQCFYVVQMDLDAKEVYITAIGGDHDYSFSY